MRRLFGVLGAVIALAVGTAGPASAITGTSWRTTNTHSWDLSCSTTIPVHSRTAARVHSLPQRCS